MKVVLFLLSDSLTMPLKAAQVVHVFAALVDFSEKKTQKPCIHSFHNTG